MTAPFQISNAPTLSVTEQNKLIAEQNAIVLKWVPKVRRNLKANAKKFINGKTKSFVTRGNKIEGKLANSIRSKTKKDFGVIEFVTFSFESHGVFVQKGVSSGHPISNPRHASDWTNPTLDKYLPELADRIIEVNADAALNATRMKIN